MGNVKTKVFLGYFTLVVLASFTVWIIYSEFMERPSTGGELTPANSKVMHINKILTYLYQSESVGRNYAQTGQAKQYREYLQLMDTIGAQIETLAELTFDPYQKVYTDSIKILLKKKHQNLRELSSVKKANSPEARYREAVGKLSTGRDSIIRLAQDSVSQPAKINKTVTTNYDSVYVKQKKKKFFARLANVFSGKKEKDSTLYVTVSQTVEFDSLMNSASSADSIVSYFTGLIEKIRNEDLRIEQQLKQKEREVLEKDRAITQQLREVLSQIENAELISSFRQISAQQERMKKATWLIIALGALSLFTIVFFLTNILKDLTKSKHYRQSLEKANAYSESLLHSKEQFMLSITHDLKSPLSSIIGFTGLLMEGSEDMRQNHYLRRIRLASEHILRLINDLLDLARLDSGKLTIESVAFNLKSLISDTVGSFKPQATEKNIALRWEYLPETSGYRSDPVRITQVLSNLISNAVKFTEHGSVTVRVSAEPLSKKSDSIIVEVIDTGIGIPQEKIQYIFEEFGRVTNSVKQYEGTGLGLTITRKLVHLLHGSVRVKSTPGNGSHFIVGLPLERDDSAGAGDTKKDLLPPTKQAEFPLKGKKVWLVDDDPVLLEMISRVLETAGMEVTAFNDPETAVREFQKGCSDLLVTDIQMPGMNGFEVMKRIRHKGGEELRAIAMSGQYIEENRRDGFSLFIQKPFSPQALLSALAGQKRNVPELPSGTRPAGRTTGGPKYSLRQIAAFASGEPDSLRNILVSFLKSGRQNALLFRKYLYDDNEKGISELAHKMLPFFRQLEAGDIVELLAALEQKNRTGISQAQWYAYASTVLDKIEDLMTTIQQEKNLPVG